MMDEVLFFSKDEVGIKFPALARISHQTLGKLGTSVPPNIPSNSFGNVFKHSLQELLEISKKQSIEPFSRAGEKYRLSGHFFFPMDMKYAKKRETTVIGSFN